VCGHVSQPYEAGYMRRCTNSSCQTTHYPRTDPVVIMLVHDPDGDRVLLGRQQHFQPFTYSALAGFVEPGETVEEAVTREVKEEVGVTVGHVRYLKSQPWPFPMNLMLGCLARAQTVDLTVDHHELEDAQWFTKGQVQQMLHNAQLEHQQLQTTDPLATPLSQTSPNTNLKLASPISLAHHLAKEWTNGVRAH